MPRGEVGNSFALSAGGGYLKKVLPLDNGISSSGIRHPILELGKQLGPEIGRALAKLPQPGADEQVRERNRVTAMSGDPARLHNCHPAKAPAVT